MRTDNRTIDQERLDSFIDDIDRNGLRSTEPLTVSRFGQYWAVEDGIYRFLAAQVLGIEELDCIEIVMEDSDEDD